MGKSRVKGIVVEIGGSTTGLDKALQGTNKNIGTTQSKLKDVERLLKLDPKNTTLLEQKQKLLAEAISETESKLDALNQANDQVKDSVKNYDAWKAAYDPIQEEIDTTSKKLKDLKAQQAEMQDCGEVDTDAYQQLTEEIQNTSRELRDLKDQAKKVSDEFGNPISRDQYDSLQREIIDTEQKLQDLSDEARKTEQNLDGLEDGVRDVADAMDDASAKTSTFGDVLKAEAIVEGAKGIASSLKDLSEDTRDYRKMMGSLEVSSEAAGYTPEQTDEAYMRFYGVLGDDQSSVTALANLQALGLSQEQLLEAIDNTIGGWAKYGDSIPIDGLAESINETVKSGQVTGTFADILNWGTKEGETYGMQLKEITALEEKYEIVTSEGATIQEKYTNWLNKKIAAGEAYSTSSVDMINMQMEYNQATAAGSDAVDAYIEKIKKQVDTGKAWNQSVEDCTSGEDFFNLALQQCTTETERANLVMQVMADQGLSAAAEKWRENNASMVESNEASADLQEQMAVLGEKIEPLVTKLTNLVVAALDWFNSLDAGTQNFILTTVLLVAALGPVVSGFNGVSSIVQKLNGTDLAGLTSTFGTITGKVLPGIQTAFSSAFGFIAANPIVWLLAAVAAMVVGIATYGDEIQAGLQKLDDFLQNVFATDWTEIFGPVLGGVLNDFFEIVKGIWDGCKKILDGVIDFIRGVFTGDWERAWNGVVKIFQGIFEGLGTILKAPLNAVIKLINGAIDGINWLINGVNKIPGVNIGTIGQIPLLASGGEVFRGSAIVGKAGPELLTVLGDRTVVQPLTNNTTNHTTHMGGINIAVYGAPGQDVRELAAAVAEEIQYMHDREEAALA